MEINIRVKCRSPEKTRCKPIALFITPVAALSLSVSSLASELQLQLGALHAGSGTEASYSWALEYRRPIANTLSASFS